MTDEFLHDNDGQDGSANGPDPVRSDTTQASAAGSGIAVGQAGAAIVVERPAPGQTVEIETAAGQTYVLDFPPADAQVEGQDGNLILGFDDDGDGTVDSRIIFLDLAQVAESGDAPLLRIAGNDVDAGVLYRQALALAGEDDVPLDEVAGGPGALGGGGTYEDDLGNTIDLLVAEGVIPPTELQFGLVDPEDEITLLEEEEEVAVDQNPALNITKTVDFIYGGDGGEGQAVDDAGDVINYTITVENTGDQTLTGVVVTDPNADPGSLVRGADLVGDNDDELEVGEVWSYTATHTVTQEEIDSNGGGDGDIDNTATVDSDQTDPDEASAEVPVEQDPALNIIKTAVGIDGGEGSAVDEAGDVINYIISVENTGNVSLTGITVDDPLTSDEAPVEVDGFNVGDTDQDGELDVGETWQYTASYTVTQDDLDSNGGGDGDVDNTATVDSDQTGPDTADESVAIERRPALNVTKVADVASVSTIGAVIGYTIEIENTGNVSLTNVTVDDPLTDDEAPVEVDGFNVGDIDQDGELDVGETWEYTASYTVTQADFDSDGGGDGTIDNTVTADSDETEPDTADESVAIVQSSPVLVVGENVGDDDDETTPHRIDDTSEDPVVGPIEGNGAGDVLIGDVGGGNLVGKVMNLALVLDTTGSMEETITFNGESMTRIEALDRAVEALLQNISETEGATVRVHMVSFASNVKKVGTFDIIENGVVNAAALQNAKDFILAAGDDPLAVADGNTNYEAGFQAALDWFSDPNPDTLLDDPDFNKTIFVSDGQPNEAYRGNGTDQVITYGNAGGGAQNSLDHVLGQFDSADVAQVDNVNEYDALLGEFKGVHGTVDAIGINVAPSALDLLDQVDGGDADSITEGQELADVLDDLADVTQLAAVGDDVIIGNGGDDLIFGDTLFTDTLADDESIDLPAGSGWSVIQQLIDDGFFGGVPSEVNANVIAFLRDPGNQEFYDFGGESLNEAGVGRAGGHDSITGGAGNDTIFGQEGNDAILGGNGDDVIVGGSGNDSMTGGDGVDTFVWTGATQDGEADILVGFDTGPGGDVIDLAGLLSGVPGGATAADLDAYLNFSSAGGDTTITVDFDGTGTGTDSSTITLQGVDLSGAGSDQDIIQSLMDGSNLTA